MPTYTQAFIMSCFVLCGFSLWFAFKEKQRLSGTLKILSSLCFLLLAWHLDLFTAYPWLTAGLIFCVLGDAWLTTAGKSKTFVIGLISFLLAHICYAVSFIKLGIDIGLVFVLMSVAIWPALLLADWIIKELSDHLKIMVCSYIAIIITMVTLAWGTNETSRGSWLVAIGATLFAASDVFVAINRFKRPAFINRLTGLPLYYLAQILIILGFYKML